MHVNKVQYCRAGHPVQEEKSLNVTLLSPLKYLEGIYSKDWGWISYSYKRLIHLRYCYMYIFFLQTLLYIKASLETRALSCILGVSWRNYISALSIS